MDKNMNILRKACSLVICFNLLFQQTGFAQIAGSASLTTSGQIDLSGYLSGLKNSLTQDVFRPAHLRYFSYDNLTDNFKLLVEKGDSLKSAGYPAKAGSVINAGGQDNKIKQEARELLKYFLTGVSLQDDIFWVNLRPDSQNQVIDNWLEKTDVGKIMLEADLQLKKDTAMWTSPETTLGRKYWDKLYKKAAELYGYDNVTIPTLTRPWIVPGEIIVRETKDDGRGTAPSAYIYKAVLKVMLEEDYLESQNSKFKSQNYNSKLKIKENLQLANSRTRELNTYSTQLIKELIIPKLTKEINSSKRYAGLRQVYYSLILSRWFKMRFGNVGAGLAPARNNAGDFIRKINSSDLSGLTSKTPWSKDTYFKQYQKSFTEGEYNIKEPVFTPTGQVIRSYFSGGLNLGTKDMAINVLSGGNINSAVLNRPGTMIMTGNAANLEIESLDTVPVVSSAVTYADAKISFEGRIENYTYFWPETIRTKARKIAKYELAGEKREFSEPTGELNSRFGYKDVNGGLRMDNRKAIVDWVAQRKQEGAKVMLHFGIGGQGMSNTAEVEYWGENKGSRIIVLDRLGTSIRGVFRYLIDELGYKASEIVFDVSSKSGGTDEPLTLYQEALNVFIEYMAEERAGFDFQEGQGLAKRFCEFFKEFNTAKTKDALFKNIPITDFNQRFNRLERERVISEVLKRIVFTTSLNAAASRLYAFTLGMEDLNLSEIGVFDFSEYTGGRFTQYCESGSTTQAFQGLDVIAATKALQDQAIKYLGSDGNDPEENSALAAAIIARNIDPSVMIVAVRSSNAFAEALQKQQLFPESNGKDGQGIWVVTSVGQEELTRKVQEIKSQTGKYPLVIIVDQKGFKQMQVERGVEVIRYIKEEISPIENAKFALWFQEFTLRYGLLSEADMADEHGIDLTIPKVGAAEMNKPFIKDGKPNFWWIRDPQNQPMVELAKRALLDILKGWDTSEQAAKKRYDAVETRITTDDFIRDDEINLSHPDRKEDNLTGFQKQAFQNNVEQNIDRAAKLVDTFRNDRYTQYTEKKLFEAIGAIRLKKDRIKMLADQLKQALSEDNQKRLAIQQEIEEVDEEIRDLYSSVQDFGKQNLGGRMEVMTKKLAALMLIAKNKEKIFSPVLYTANPDADILAELAQFVDYGIGTRDQHANFQHRHDGKDVTFTLLVDFVMTYDQVQQSQSRIYTYGLANDYLHGLYPDEVRRGFIQAEFASLSGKISTEAVDYQGKSYQKSFHRDVAILTLPDLSTPNGMVTAISIFNRAQHLYKIAVAISSSVEADNGIQDAGDKISSGVEQQFADALKGDTEGYLGLKNMALNHRAKLISYFEDQVKEGRQILSEDLFGRGFGYDVRGNALELKNAHVDLTPLSCYIIGKALGTKYADERDTVLLTGDQRWHTPALRLALGLGFISVGVNVQFSDEIIGTGEHGLLSGENPFNNKIMIQISGSHGVPEKNGLKIKVDKDGSLEPLYGQDLAEVYNAAKKGSFRDIQSIGFLKEKTQIISYLIDTYDRSIPQFNVEQPIVFDCRNSALVPALKGLVAKRQLKNVRWKNDEPDPAMPGGIWDPSKAEALIPCQMMVKEWNTELEQQGSYYRAIGFVFDGDGDRTTAIREDGVDVPSFEMTLPFYQRFISDPVNREVVKKLRQAGADKIWLVCDIRSNSTLLGMIDRYDDFKGVYLQPGYPPQRDFVRWRISELRKFIAQTPALNQDEKFMKNFEHFVNSYFTAEASGHQFFHVCPNYPEKVIDAGIATVFNLLHIKETIPEVEARDKQLNLTSKTSYSIAELFEAFPKAICSDEVRIVIPNSIKVELEKTMVRRLSKYYEGKLLSTKKGVTKTGNMFIQPKEEGAITVEGIKIQLNTRGSSLFRKSNTGEQATLIFEGSTPEELMQLMEDMEEQIIKGLEEIIKTAADSILTDIAKIDTNDLRVKREKAKTKYFGSPARTSVSSAVMNIMDDDDAMVDTASQMPPGGIDFRGRAMSINYEAIGSFKGLDIKLPKLSASELDKINIDSEISQIKKMVSSGISPSGRRIIELAAACEQKGKMSAYASDLLLCVMGACELAEVNADESSLDFKTALVAIDSRS